MSSEPSVADDFPSKEGTHLPKGVRFGVAKHDDVLRIATDAKCRCSVVGSRADSKALTCAAVGALSPSNSFGKSSSRFCFDHRNGGVAELTCRRPRNTWKIDQCMICP